MNLVKEITILSVKLGDLTYAFEVTDIANVLDCSGVVFKKNKFVCGELFYDNIKTPILDIAYQLQNHAAELSDSGNILIIKVWYKNQVFDVGLYFSGVGNVSDVFLNDDTTLYAENADGKIVKKDVKLISVADVLQYSEKQLIYNHYFTHPVLKKPRKKQKAYK